MITLDHLRTLSLSFPETTESPHFDKSSFRVRKKIFITYDGEVNTTNIKLTPENQDVFCLGDKGLSPVPNKWAKQGWKAVDMTRVHRQFFEDAIIAAYCTVAPKKLAEEVRLNSNECNVMLLRRTEHTGKE
ncbi:MAG: MmcQ/YjbR family DNA-binding protein [Cyclobacteriaceae bacterium]